MLRIVRSHCPRCKGIYFKFDQEYNFDQGSWITCIKCNLQILTTEYRTVYRNDEIFEKSKIDEILKDVEGFLEIEKKREEEEKQARISKEIQEEEYRKKKIEEYKEKKMLEEKLNQQKLILAKEQEKLKQQKQEAAKKLAIKRLESLFINNYLKSRRVWETELSNLISEEEFVELSVNFVISWFSKQGWKVPDVEQARCITELWDDLQVYARAGSGKTSTTVSRAAFLVKHCRVDPGKILLLAFNREAAEEINKRLQEFLGEDAPKAMTFHALAHAIVQPKEKILYDSEKNGYEKSKFIQNIINSYLYNQEKLHIVTDIMIRYFRGEGGDFEKLEEQLSPKEIVEYRRSLPYIGFDGVYYKSMGEKRIADFLFEHRIQYKYEYNYRWGSRNYRPDFTIFSINKQIKGIIVEYFGMLGDKNYDKQIIEKKHFWERQKGFKLLDLYPGQADSFELLDQSLGEYLRSTGDLKRKLTDNEIWNVIKPYAVDNFSKIVSHFIDRCRNSMISLESLEEKIQNQSHAISDLQFDFLKIIVKIYSIYLKNLRIKEMEDFNGLLMDAIKLVNSGKSSWERGEGSGELVITKFLFIDEYQDFSILFYELVKSIKFQNESLKLFCVGDDWQAINGFAGSDLCFFRDFQTYFPNSKRFNISSNRRSTKKIVNIGNNLMDGEGIPSKSVSNEEGIVGISYLDEFKPNPVEKELYQGDKIIPALIRMVYFFTKKGQRVALISRKNSGLPWLTQSVSKSGHFQTNFLGTIKSALPKNQRNLVAMGTAHSYKGREEEVVILVDAVHRSYPLIHPSHIFFSVLGETVEKVISEEKRLLYVAMSRPTNALIILTEKENESPFLDGNLKYMLFQDKLDINRLEYPKEKGSYYIIEITKGTYNIRQYLAANQYIWDSMKKAWKKSFPVDAFTKERLLKEPWVKYANDILIHVEDEFGNKICSFKISGENIVEM